MKSVRVPLAWLRFLGDVIRDERLLIFLHDWRVTEVSLPLATRQTHPHLPDRDFAVFSHTSASSEDVVVDNVNVYERWKETVFLCPPASSSSENDIDFDFDARQVAFPQLMGLFLRDPALDQRVYGAERVQRAISTYAELLELARAKRDAAARRGDEGGEMLLTRPGQQELFEEMYDQEDLLPRPRSPAPTGLLVDVGAGDMSSGFHDLMAWFDLWWGWVKLRRRYRTSLSSRNGVLEDPAQHPVPTRSSHPLLDAFVKQKVVAPTHPMAAEDELPDLGDYSAESGTDLVWNVFPRDYDKFLELSVVENLRIRRKLEDMDSFFPRCAEWPHCSARRAAMVENVAMFDQWRECILRTWHGFDENEKIVASPVHSRPGRATGAHDHAEEVEFLEGHQAAEDATRTAPAGVQHMFEDFVGGRVFNLVADAATAAGGYRLLQQRRMALSYNLSAVLDNISVNATGTTASAATKELNAYSSGSRDIPRRAASTGFPALKVRALAEAVASEVPVVGLSEVLGYFEQFLGYVWDPLALKIDAQGNDYDVWQSAYGDSDKDNDKDTFDYEGVGDNIPTTASSRPKLKSYEFDTVLLETQDLEKEHPLAMYDSPKEYYYGNLTEEFARRGYEECFCSINTPAFAEINCAFTRRNSFG
eukprot:g10292.t1